MTVSAAAIAFCRFYGFRPDYLDGPDRYEITGASPPFDGRIQALTVLRNGRFGNIVLQLLHATMIARQLRVEHIRAFPFPGGSDQPTLETHGINYHFADRYDDNTPALCGEFFNSYAFQSALTGLHTQFVAETLDKFLRPLFAERLEPAPSGGAEAVLHFRSGDIFQQPPNSTWYVQPPCAYYLRAFQNLRENCGVTQARLVFEDRRNPAVDAVEATLHAAGVPVALTDGSFEADLAALLGATHIIASFSTFPEAAALLSHNLRSFTAFRALESHAHLHAHRPRSLLGDILHHRQVRAFLLTDATVPFIRPLDWHNTSEQRQRIVDYPTSGLDLTEPAHDALAGDRALLANAVDEAISLRAALIVARLDALKAAQPPPRPPSVLERVAFRLVRGR